jgi:hypothetical protein
VSPTLLAVLGPSQVLALDEDKVTPGALGFLVVVLLGVATWLLIRSMNKQMKKVDFEERDPRADDDPGRR